MSSRQSSENGSESNMVVPDDAESFVSREPAPFLTHTAPESESTAGWIKHNHDNYNDSGSSEDDTWIAMNSLGCSRDSLEIHRKRNPDWHDWKEQAEPKKDKSALKRLKNLISKSKLARKKSVNR